MTLSAKHTDVDSDSISSRFQHALQDLVHAKKASGAAQLVLKACHRHLTPVGDALRPWLIATAGDDGYALIVNGFARLGSGCCMNGLEICDACEGTGFFNEPCAACAGFGKGRCGFCGGSALLPYEEVPKALIADVALARLALVEAGIKAVTTSANEELHGFATVDHSTKNLFNAEKLLGVTANALAEVRRRDASPLLREITPRIEAAAKALRVLEFKVILKSLQQAWRVRAVEAPEADRPEAETRAKYYEAMRRAGSFSGTGLARPDVFQADKPLPTPVVSSSNSDSRVDDRLQDDTTGADNDTRQG